MLGKNHKKNCDSRRKCFPQLLFIGLSLLGLFLLLACNKQSNGSSAAIGRAARFQSYTAKELIDGIASGYLDVEAYNISANDQILEVYGASGGVLQQLPMPASLFYLAVAPYLDRTHGCRIHSVTGCRGELEKVDVQVLLRDSSGKVLLDRMYNTGSNGFVDLWLPRQLENAKLEIFYGGMRAEKRIHTVSGEPTCETTMKLLSL